MVASSSGPPLYSNTLAMKDMDQTTNQKVCSMNDVLVNGTPALVFKIRRGIPAMHQI